MRQGQQNKRMRGRGRKVSNPLNRIYESSGPDVKVRGTANHVAEKYLALARDAQASGDPVSSENYLQHAEHYLRIIAAAQTQNQQQRPGSAQGSGDSETEMNGAEVPQAARNDDDADGEKESGDADVSARADQAPAQTPARGRRKRPAAPKDDAAPEDQHASNGARSRDVGENAEGDGDGEGGANGSGETPEAVA
jgi:hypothetical protein